MNLIMKNRSKRAEIIHCLDGLVDGLTGYEKGIQLNIVYHRGLGIQWFPAETSPLSIKFLHRSEGDWAGFNSQKYSRWRSQLLAIAVITLCLLVASSSVLSTRVVLAHRACLFPVHKRRSDIASDAAVISHAIIVHGFEQLVRGPHNNGKELKSDRG